MERTLKDLSVEGVKTRKKPNKHIVFSVKVMWSDGQVNVVSRRYSEFFELMEKLNQMFPVEAGKHKNSKRILPNLQAKKTFLVTSSVMKQLERITHFTKELVHLPDHISQCHIVRNFFTPTEADIESIRKSSLKKPKTKSRNWRRKNSAKKVLSISGPMSLEQFRVIADVEVECNTGLDLKEGQIVEVIEKLETGWWLVTADGEQGWVPASYLSNEDDPAETMTTMKYQPGQGECYVTRTSYTATFKDELSFDIGVHLQVIEKNLDGWWRAIYNGCEGLVPAAYLKKVGDNQSRPDGNKPPPVRKRNVISKRYSVSSQQSDMTDETLVKLRESTFKSPEENKEQSMLPKRKLTRAERGKVHLELKTSVDGGWVPQMMPTTSVPEKETKTSQDKEKGFSLLKGFRHRKTRQSFDESDDEPKKAEAKKNLLNLHLPQANKKANKMSEEGSHVGKTRLYRKESDSCSNLASSSNCLEEDTFDEHKDDDDFHLDEDEESSDEDICTLDDLLNEEKESNGSGYYCEGLPDNERKMSSERESFDSGMGSSPPLSPGTMGKPYNSAASNMYVAIADHQGIKEDGEVDLFEGQQVRVLQKTVGGWWLVEDDADQRGWAPSNFLEYFEPGFKKQQLDETFCYVSDAGVSEDIERNVIKLSDGQELKVVDTNKNGHFMLVRVPSKFAWISKASVLE